MRPVAVREEDYCVTWDMSAIFGIDVLVKGAGSAVLAVRLSKPVALYNSSLFKRR
jgi:hypothetical protein